ncbi:MAG: hypothetical protein JRJ65_09660 [Deltaproteobacteria bacterium]|nr:hypothetical protein [Deltaproteobacteria bacterium]
MLQYSTVFRPLFWIVMGLIYAVIIVGAKVWAEDLGLQMTWWKWLLSAIWYCLLSFSFAAGFTLIGEKEPKAGYRFLGTFLAITIISGFGLWYLVG